MKNYPHIPFRPARLPIYYGWIIILVGTLGIIFSIPGQTMGISVFTDYLIESLNLSRDSLSIAYLVGTIGSSFLLTHVGLLYDKFGARVVAIGASVVLAASVTFASYAPIISNKTAAFFNISYPIISFTIITLSFLLIRLSGQGALTLASRNMIMKWFDKKRGMANAFSSSVTSLMFALSPLVLSIIISQSTSWGAAWRIIAIALLGFAVLVFFLFRDNPEECGLIPDGKSYKRTEKIPETKKQFTLKEVFKTWAFWIFTFTMGFYTFFGTGFTFHVVSILESYGYTKQEGLSIFIPISIVSVVISIIANLLSDYFRLQYVLFAMLFGSLMATVSFTFLDTPLGYYFMIGGLGIMGGLFMVLVSVTWPRFYGRQHLGAISGFSSSVLVFASAIGPIFFSKIYTITGTYNTAGIIGLFIVAALIIFGIKAKNPQ